MSQCATHRWSKLLLPLAVSAWALGLVALLALTLGGPLFIQRSRDIFMEPHLIAGGFVALAAAMLAVMVAAASAVLAAGTGWPRRFAVPLALSLSYLIVLGGVVARAL